MLFDNTDFNIQADRVLLKQAVFNIVHNAIRYSDNEAVIKISQTGNVLSIKNFGTGIAQADLGRVFEPFYCIDKSRSKKYGGSGLGLAIAKDIADRHGFTITAKSKVDEYVEISIRFSENINEKVYKKNRKKQGDSFRFYGSCSCYDRCGDIKR